MKLPFLNRGSSASLAEAVFDASPSGKHEARIKPLVPVTIAYSYGISDKSCTVAASTILQPGRSYIVLGSPTFHQGLLTVFNGCEIRLLDAETSERQLLLPPLAPVAPTACTPD